MIEKLTVIDTKYSGLEKYFPARLELDVSSQVVLLVGPNGSGKTAFIRFLSSSLQNERYFREHGLPGNWRSLEKSVKGIEKIVEVLDGWFYPGADLIKYYCSELKHNPYLDHELNEREDIKSFGKALINEHLPLDYPKLSVDFYHLISASAREKLRKLPEILSQDNDFNRWRYLKASPFQPRYMQEFRLPLDKKAMAMEMKRYCAFDPDYDGSAVIPPKSFKRYLQETAEMNIRDLQGESLFASRMRRTVVESRDWLKRYPVEIDRIESRRKKQLYAPSPGQALRENIEAQLAEIEQFFIDGINHRWEVLNDAGHVTEISEVEHERQKYEQASEEAELIVFMDEPTMYLDYCHKHEFIKKIQELAERYPRRLQFFIPTNDAVLIEKMPRCRYVNLYTRPATAAATFALP